MPLMLIPAVLGLGAFGALVWKAHKDAKKKK